MRDGAEVRHEAVAALRADSVVSQPQHRHVRAEIGDVEERRVGKSVHLGGRRVLKEQSGQSLDVSLTTDPHQRLHAGAADAVARETDALQVGTGAHDQAIADASPVLLGDARALVLLHRLHGEALQTGEAGRAETVEERLVGLCADDTIWVRVVRYTYCR